ncbi:hypothetical protein [Nocardioides gilvus]|uniref:hypothetical protein n=1 Tax=Nocardioides gilvus TaxID=1735589 RepID=UPI000D74BD3E|nr:hypothetical protein [Nocardioides gilvus]
MIILLALPILTIVAFLHRYVKFYAPSNLLIRRIRGSSPRLRTVAMLAALSAILLLAMKLVSKAVEAGAPGWLNLVVLLLAWDTIKIALLALSCAVRGIARRIVGSYESLTRPGTSSVGA